MIKKLVDNERKPAYRRPRREEALVALHVGSPRPACAGHTDLRGDGKQAEPRPAVPPCVVPFPIEECPLPGGEAIGQTQDTADALTVPLDKAVGGTVEAPFSATYCCGYIVMDATAVAGRRSSGAVGSASGVEDSINQTCRRGGSTDETYYVASPGSYGTVPYYGASNGHVLNVRENSIRVGQYACANLYVNSRSRKRYSDTYGGTCGIGAGQVFFKGGYDRVGSSWCDGHPGGSTGDPNDNIRGRCRYVFVRH